MARSSPHLILALLLAGCSNLRDKDWTGWEGGGGDTDTAVDDSDTDTGGDTAEDTADTSDSDSGAASDATFDDPGDVVEYEDQDGIASIDLADASGESNQGQDFYLVVVNTGESDVGYNLRYYESSTPSGPRVPPGAAAPTPRATRPARITPPAAPPPPPMDDADVGLAKDEFLVRSDLQDEDTFATVNATLWALGDNVAIWVDDDVYIDWDYECDGVVDEAHPFGASGFDNCDLETVADIIDDNIVPNVRSLFGQESDINGDGRVSVVISPVLNAITLTSSDEADFTEVLSSYAEPEVDLNTYDYESNPGSDQQEVIYVFAPDPNGYANPNAPTDVEDYTSYRLAAEVARSFTTLVSYNQKEQAGGSMDEDWLVTALGAFAADYCGFGAAWHELAWEYLDAPWLHPLVDTSSDASLTSSTFGAQYLFARWLYDYVEQSQVTTGAAIFQSIVQRSETGTEAVEAAFSEAGFEVGFTDLAILWQVALLTSGATDDDGDALVDTDVYPPFADASTIVAPPESPGANYGANGYQSGINVAGLNQTFTYGHTAAPEELTSRRVLLENQDRFLYTPGFEFVGYVKSGYAAQVVRLTGIPYDEALVQLQASDSGVVGAVVRWNDPTSDDYTIENVFAPTDANAVSLPALPDDGSIVQGVGQLTAAVETTVIASNGDEEAGEVLDVDRWLLDLSDYVYGERLSVAIWLDRHYTSTSGAAGPEDPWIAIVPAEYVPTPTSDGTTRGSACPDGVDFTYPVSVLDYLYDQVILSSTMTADDVEDFDACGVATGATTTCDEDWDRDGVLDDDEPTPGSFHEQVLVMECTATGSASSSFAEEWLDIDELDEDEVPSRSLVKNTGGRAIEDGEEGYVAVSLQGGRQYVIVVAAADGSTGTYELSVRRTE